MEHTATLQSVPSIQELDAAWPRVKDRVRKAEQRVLDVAWQVVEYPSDSGYRQDLEVAVREHRAATDAEFDHHDRMAAACRREEAWSPPADRRATWEVAS